MLAIGQKVQTWLAKETLTVQKKLGEGGQGIVYLVDGQQYGKKALKWYNKQQATPEQKSAIIDLIRHGLPEGIAGQRFIWPIDIIVDEKTNRFGYIMDVIDKKKYANLGEVWANIKPAPSFRTMCIISYQVAESFRKLHLDGFCYRDISADNMLFCPTTGDVLICDNDNVGISNYSVSQVLGTMEYMAPEIITKKAVPSTETDLHSLAVLFFQLWIWHHPFHGMMEYIIRSWDIPAKTRVYGENPVFVFDPKDDSNTLPDDSEYDTAKERWKVCPPPLKELFIRAFTDGLHDPSKRVTEGEWRRLFMQLEDSIIRCPHDMAENIWDGRSSVYCWHCGKPLTIPPRLFIQSGYGSSYVLLTSETKLKKRHIDEGRSVNDEEESVVAEVVQNPKNPKVWGLRNLTLQQWTATKPDGSEITIEPNRAVTLMNGIEINFGTTITGLIEG